LVQQYPAVQRAEVLAILSRVAAGETITGFESRRKHKNGSDIYISATISPIHDDVGQVSGASMVARDISQRIKDQEARKLIEARFESLFNAMEEGFYLAELVFDDAGLALLGR
jgi:PAS domain-containing protein